MTTTYFIAGSIFLAFTMLWAWIQWKAKRNEDYEKAKKDLDAAVDGRDWNAVDDAVKRMREKR